VRRKQSKEAALKEAIKNFEINDPETQKRLVAQRVVLSP